MTCNTAWLNPEYNQILSRMWYEKPNVVVLYFDHIKEVIILWRVLICVQASLVLLQKYSS